MIRLGQFLPPEPFPTPAPEGEYAAEARGYYCGTIAVEFMHIPSPEQRQWIQEQMERKAPTADQTHILTQLIRADLFEQVIQSRYLGTKRFSLEGLTALIPFLDRVLGVERWLWRDEGDDCDEPSRTAERDDEHDRPRRLRRSLPSSRMSIRAARWVAGM